MKISKLFHWLYAFLMFLPIVLFIPNAFYYGFNEHATNSETTTINYKYQSNEVNSVDDLVEGNIYSFNTLGLYLNNLLTEDETFEFLLLSDLEFNDALILESTNGIQKISSYTYLRFYVLDDSEMYIMVFNDSDFSPSNLNITFEFYDSFASDCVIQLLGGYYFNSPYLVQKLSYTDYNVIESVEVNTNDTISNKMYYAWQSTWNLPLLQWTHTSFVAQPFTYITGLFGIPSDSSFNYLFTYFVTISICWLVFDLLMYVPNLAHRWLDKGALE